MKDSRHDMNPAVGQVTFSFSAIPTNESYRVATDIRFITVSIANPKSGLRSPGDYSAAVPQRLFGSLRSLADTTQNSDAKAYYQSLANQLWRRAIEMGHQKDPYFTWWQPEPSSRVVSQSPNEMTYECDAKLGSPALVDCSQLEWQGLGFPSDTVTVSPSTPKSYLSSMSDKSNKRPQRLIERFLGSCGVNISATTPVVLLASQIKAAFAALLSTCIENPIRSSQGGRAYYGLYAGPSISMQDIFKTKHPKRTANPGVSGLKALPPHVNMTIFAHDVSKDAACEEQAARQRQPVSACKTT